MIKESIEGLGDFEFYRGYFIGRIYEGVNADFNYIDELSGLIQKHFMGQPVVYISDRVNSYSVDPVDTQKLIDRNNIHHAGVVSYSSSQLNQFYYQNQVQKRIEMESFNSLDAAIHWAEQKSSQLGW